jgi:cell division protein FtsQ
MMTRNSGIASALATVVVLVLLAVLTAGSRQVVAENQWPIEWIEVQGEFERVTAEQVKAATVPMLQNGFFGIQLDRVRARVEELAWVRAAEVRKVWPDQLVVRVDEHQPLARWQENQLVSDLGEVFSVEGMVAIEGLLKLSGPDGMAPEMIEFYSALRQRLKPTGLDVLTLTLSHRGGWEAGLSDGMTLVIGRDQPMKRVDRLVSALEDLRADPTRRPLSIDLRYTNGFAVRWLANDEAEGMLAVSHEEAIQP